MRRASTLLVTVIGVAVTALSAWTKPGVRLVYNASDSAPRGVYLVGEASHLRVGDYVVARLPDASAMLAAERGYLPRSVPVLKQIAAVTGQEVCIRDGAVYVDSRAVARTLEKDGQHRDLRSWQHCRTLLPRELFLLNPDSSASFDSRYIGPVDTSFVIGRATRW